MTDKELLIWAAKAAGIDAPDYMQDDGTYVYAEPYKKNWNPLADDGDALRLAVNLGLSVITEPFFVRVHNIRGVFLVREEVGVDGYTATRRSIVRATAEIGKAIK